jgi:hypothetical protein
MGKRTLRDLYVVGKELSLDDGGGSVEVWLQKLNPVDHRHAVSKADASRARVLAVRSTPESDDYFAILNGVLDFDKDQLVNLLAAVETVRINPLKRSEIAGLDEWADEGYLEGLQDIWDSEINDRFVENPEDVEAKRVHDELERYLAAVAAEIADAIDVYSDGLHSMTLQELQDMGVAYEMKNSADMAWIQTYYRWELFYGVRQPHDHRQRYFAEASDIDELNGDLIGTISAAFRALTVEPTEGKDLAGNPPSSTSSAPSAEAATPASSGPPTA